MQASLRGIVAVLLLVTYGGPQQPQPALAAYVDVDLQKLDQDRKAKLTKQLAILLPKEYQPDRIRAPKPWFIWKNVFAKEQKGFILFEGARVIDIPSQAFSAVHVFDDSGKWISSFGFSTGWRIDLDAATLKKDEGLKGYCIDVRSSPVINGHDICRQVYGLIGNRLALLWLEDSTGKMISNNYRFPNHTIGPQVPKRNAAQWESMLSSDDPLVNLEALTWLGGDHRDISERVGNVLAEGLESATLVNAVRQRQAVLKALVKLSGSDVPRVQEAARLTLRQIIKQPG
ncbi:MAG: hypothetical protein QM703_11310 [Gemmatales bacterium]